MTSNRSKVLRAGTRGSALALWQTRSVMEALNDQCDDVATTEVVIKTAGDRDRTTPLAELGGEGLFIKEIERALLEGEIDFAVHSLKDMPVVDPKGLLTVATPPRERWNDIFVSRDYSSLEEMPPSSTVGTGSPRRKAQLKWAFPEPEVVPIRGNVETRVEKVRSGEVQGIIIAQAGANRLGGDLLKGLCVEVLKSDIMLPAPGQGAIALQCRADDPFVREILQTVHCENTWTLVKTERAFLQHVGGGCHTPVGALARKKGTTVHLDAAVAPDEDSFLIRLSGHCSAKDDPLVMAKALAEEARMWLGVHDD